MLNRFSWIAEVPVAYCCKVFIMKKRYNVKVSNTIRYFFKLINGNTIVFNERELSYSHPWTISV